MLLKSKDIAEMLNISPATVSLALNNKPGVSAETKNKIYAILEEYYASGNFSTDENSGMKGTIVLVVHKGRSQLFIPTIFFQDVIDNIQSVMIHRGYQLEIIYFNTGMDSQALLDSLNRENVAGVLLYATEMPYDDISVYSDLQKPIVVLDSRLPRLDMDMVTLSNRSSVTNAVEYVYHMGHRKIGFLKSKSRINNFDDRYGGYLDGLHLLGLDFCPDFVFDIASSTDDACSDFLKILDRPKESLPTVFLTDLDYTIVGALLAIKMKGYSVPEDFSLVGFDDLSFMAELDPPITSIQIKPYFGSIAAERLIAKIDKNDAYHVNIEVAAELKIRNSVKKIEHPEE